MCSCSYGDSMVLGITSKIADSNIERNLMHLLQKEGIAVVTITHDMEFVARNFDRVVAMAHRNILADGTAAEIFGNDQVVNEARIRRPQLAQLTLDLGLQGILNGDELVNALD